MEAKQAEELAAVRRGASELASRAEAGAAKIFSGSSDGRSYAADSPVLGTFFNPKPVPVRPASSDVGVRSEASSSTASVRPTAVAVRRSLAELRDLPAAELKLMLARRGVGPGTAADKDGLAEWVYQHQDLPERQKDSKQVQTQQAPASKSVAELSKKSVRELRDMLDERGVSSSGKTEKGELTEWVYQHQHLPALYKQSEDDRERGPNGRWERGPGKGKSYTKQHKKKELRGDEVKLLEATDEEAEATKLLEEGSPPKTEAASKIWKALGMAGAVTAVGVAGTIAMINRKNKRI